jgi:ABC-type amino acid transport substrate-binding protein
MKFKDPILKVALAVVLTTLVVFIVNCSKSSPTSSPKSTESTLQRVLGTKVVHAVYLVYPPTVSVEKDASHPSGFLVDVMNEIASRAGFQVEYSPTTFDDMKLAISSPNNDVVVGAIFINVPRAKEMDFTTPILYWRGTLGIAAADKAPTFSTWDAVDKPGIRIAVSAGTAEYDYVKQHIHSASINAIPNSDLALTLAEVTSGRADLAFGDAITISKFLNTHSDVALIMGGKQFNGFAASFVTKQNDTAWTAFLSQSITALQVDGTIAALSHKWGGENIWLLPKPPWE